MDVQPRLVLLLFDVSVLCLHQVHNRLLQLLHICSTGAEREREMSPMLYTASFHQVGYLYDYSYIHTLHHLLFQCTQEDYSALVCDWLAPWERCGGVLRRCQLSQTPHSVLHALEARGDIGGVRLGPGRRRRLLNGLEMRRNKLLETSKNLYNMWCMHTCTNMCVYGRG